MATATKAPAPDVVAYRPSVRAEEAYGHYTNLLGRKQTAEEPPALPDEARKFWWCFTWDCGDMARRHGNDEFLPWADGVTTDFPALESAPVPEPEEEPEDDETE